MPLNNFKGKYSQGSFPILTDEHLDCNSKNIVYLVTCKLCAVQYIGETARAFGVRMREHWDKIRKGDRSQLVYEHFQSDERHRSTQIEDMLRFQIIEKIRTDNLANQDQSLIRKRRLERELFWIARLRTAYPLGLNDRLQALGIAGNATDKNFEDFNFYRVANLFSIKPRKNRGRRLKKKKGGFGWDDFASFRDELEHTFRSDKRQLETLILSKQRAFLERFIAMEHFATLPKEVRYFLKNRVSYSKKTKPVRKKEEPVIWKIGFTHKILEDLNLRAIYNMKDVRQLLPAEIRKKNVFKQVFSYNKTIGSKILNYNKVLKEVQDLTYDDIASMECECSSSRLSDAHHGHVMTGNLDIIRDDKLKQLCSYGTKFREVPSLRRDDVKRKFRESVDELILKLVRKHKIPKNRLKCWQERFLYHIDRKIDCLGRTKRWNAPVLSNRDSKLELDRLQERFVITVVDKAAGNFAFTCRKFYLLRLAQELGLNNRQPGNDTYEFQDNTEEVICNDLFSKLGEFNALPGDSDRKIAMLYHNPKFHKNPVKFRFIAGNVKVATSKLDEIVAKILKMCKGHFANLCKKYEGFSGVRYCFDIEKSADLKVGLDRFQGDARSISINDFATLYTLFEHDHLVSNMTWMLGRLSKNSGCQSVRVNHDSAHWARNNNSEGTYSITEIIEMISFLIGNSYIKAFGRVFRQTKGIIMGGKSSGWLSDCSLMVDEFKFIDRKVKEGSLELARSFRGLNRYRDDCTALNIDDFRQLARDIYPPSLELSQENDDLNQATVLDMHVTISEGHFRTKVYNKTDSFPFEVISMPFLESNIDRRICYKVFYSQVLRYERLCSDQEDFTDRVRLLGNTLLRRGYNLDRINKEFRRVIGTYRTEFERWDIPTDSQIWFKDIFNNPLNANSLNNAPLPIDILPFSQPLPDNLGPRLTFFSQH